MQELHQQVFIDQLESTAEQQISEVVGLFQNLPESLLLQPSAMGGWSIQQCMEHLNTYAAFYLPRLHKVLSASESVRGELVFSHSWLGHYFIKSMDAEKSTKKYKAMKRHRPVSDKSPYEEISIFIQHMEHFLSLLQLAHDKKLAALKVGTSISPWIKMNAGDTFQFLLVHNRRHLIQAYQNIPAEMLAKSQV